jgi:predicted ester cyclase
LSQAKLLSKEESASMPVEASRVPVSRLYEEAWGRGKPRPVDEMVAPGFFDHHHRQGGPENLKRIIWSVRTTFLDMKFVLEEQVAEGNRVVSRWALHGIDKDGLLGLPPTGGRATFEGISADCVVGDQIVEHRGQSDMLGLLRQLGLMPALD